MEELKKKIRNVPDFPEEGIIFRDITTLLKDSKSFKKSVDMMCEKIQDEDVDVILGIESRGFIFGAPMAYKLDIPFNIIRKPGKLPAETRRKSYSLEYGHNTIEIHTDAVSEGDKIVICDDLLATGGTASAAAELVENLGGNISCFIFLIELSELKGREKLSKYSVHSIVKF